jgi:phosphoesterase RecJ-like protein
MNHAETNLADTNNATWGSGHGAPELASWLGDKSRVLVLTHAKPDGDAIGSSIALVRALRRTPGRQAIAAFTGAMPHWTGDLARRDEYIEGAAPLAPFEPDAVVIVDTGSWTQLDALAPLARGRARIAAIIDHHLDGAVDMAERRLVDTGASAVCVLLAELCARLVGAGSARELPADIATPLYFGCATDTGWFRFPNTNARILALAADLQRAGAAHAHLYEVSEQRQRAGRIRVLGRALSGMTMHLYNQLAVARITLDDIKQTGAIPGDTGGFGDVMLSIEGVRISAILTESNPAPLIKVSLRSKPGPSGADVHAIASALGGGGHAQASGVKLAVGMDDAVRIIEEACRGALA